MIIDTHLHLMVDEYDNISEIINEANDVGVRYLILAGTNNNDNNNNASLLGKYNNIFLSVGIHPEFCLKYNLNAIELIIKKFKERIIAIGEIGLDYHYDDSNKEIQKTLFMQQLSLAEKYNLPVVIHSRDAIFDTINILKQYKVYGVIHCFSGSVEIAKEYLKMGFYLGIGGVVTFKNSKLADTLKEIPIDRIVLETDSPFLSPIRGEINYPKNIVLVAKCLANIYNVSYDDICKITTLNAIKLFNLEKLIK